ncbi:hypothetical protein FHS78_002663 [Parvibaculum indicum]|uniref:hypothetical protein n=1 Tax=Parvibaculum indicum TaxID=562969 RepID=UPI001421842E|nr:hypothetical protein [Parvibaculum indicum]NIJ42369.1 hypothetical protein [Parvibaculum indicum]
MKNWIAALVVALLLVPGSSAFAGSLESLSDVKALTDSAMKDISGGKIDAGFEALKPHVGFSQEQFGEFKAHVADQMPQVETHMGKNVGYELVEDKELGTSLYRAVYLQKQETSALVWYFTFYKGADGWTLNDFDFNDHIKDLF